MSLILLLFLAQADSWTPKPLSTWQVSFVPELALVWDDGSSLLIGGEMVYTYDRAGQLKESFKLPANVEAAFSAPDNQALVYFDHGVLANLSEKGGLRWQKEIKPPSAAPLSFGQYLVWAHDDNVEVLDPKDGSTRYSLRLDAAVGSVQVESGWIWISDQEGQTFGWEPSTQKKQAHATDLPLNFVSRSPIGELALIARGGAMEVRRADGKRLWQRNVHIDIASPAIFLKGRHTQMLVATKGRNLFVYGSSKGEQLARRLMGGRPKALIDFDHKTALLISERVKELLWYNAETRRFASEAVAGRILYATSSASSLLLVDENGIITLYSK